MKKIILSLIGSIVLIGCGTQQVIPQQKVIQSKKQKFQNLTKDICIENEHEVRLAQALWIEIMKTK